MRTNFLLKWVLLPSVVVRHASQNPEVKSRPAQHHSFSRPSVIPPPPPVRDDEAEDDDDLLVAAPVRMGDGLGVTPLPLEGVPLDCFCPL